MRDLAGRGQADGRDPPAEAVAPARRSERQPAVGLRGGHPTAEQLEAVAYGWLAEAAAQHLRVHAVTCRTCGPRLAAEQELRRRLELLRGGEPRVDLVAAVLRQLPPIGRESTLAAGG